MSLQDQKAAALAEVLAATGEEIVRKGRTLHALVSDNPLSQDLGLGGFVQVKELANCAHTIFELSVRPQIATDGGRKARLGRLAGKHGFQREAQIVTTGRGAGAARLDRQVIDAAAVEQLARGGENRGFGYAGGAGEAGELEFWIEQTGKSQAASCRPPAPRRSPAGAGRQSQ